MPLCLRVSVSPCPFVPVVWTLSATYGVGRSGGYESIQRRVAMTDMPSAFRPAARDKAAAIGNLLGGNRGRARQNRVTIA